MPPLDTLPMQLDAVAAAHGGLEEFRITSQAELLSTLKSLADGNVLVNLNGSDGAAYTTPLGQVPVDRAFVSFSADADVLGDHELQAWMRDLTDPAGGRRSATRTGPAMR